MFSTYKEVWKIVKNSIQIMQIIAFSISALIGVFVILFSVYCFLDFKEIVHKDTSIFKEEFVIISKKVSAIQTVTNTQAGFTEREIKKLKEQEFCKEVAVFQPSRHKVHFRSDDPYFPLRTDLFFESVPDKYLSITDEDWKWEDGQEMVPIIIPRNFISLYNFGFAPSQGNAQISESLITKKSFTVRLKGKGKTIELKAKIVDFSDRINTILVPQDFLTWSNAELGYKSTGKPSRLIVETDNIADSRIFEYIASNNFQINEDSLLNSKLSFYLKLTLTIVAIIGLIITLLAVWLLVFSFHLIIEKNKTKIQNLFYIGYSFGSILLPYNLISIGANVIIVILASIAAGVSNGWVVDKLTKFLPIESVSYIIPIFASLAILFGIILINYFSIRRVLKQAIA